MRCIPYEDDDDAVRIANNSRYGLSGAVTSASLDRAVGGREAYPHRHGVGERRACGSGPTRRSAATRQSGIGREHGIAGFEEYLETKTLGLPAPA